MVAANSLNITEVGFQSFDGVSVFKGRTLTAGTGVTITNGTGVSGNPTISSTGSVALQFTGNSGVATPSSNNLNVITSNSTVKFVGSGSTLTQNFGVNNLGLGSSFPSLTSGSGNVAIGSFSLNGITTGSGNITHGVGAGLTISTGSENVFIGAAAGDANNGDSNVGIGFDVFPVMTTGSSNIGIGRSTGSLYSTSESNNILIQNTGTVADANTLRIGTQGSGTRQINKAFIAGIIGNTVSNTQMVTIDSTSGQLGVATVPGGTSVNFQAYLTSNQTVAGGSTAATIIFDTAISNVGSGYNTSTGVFTAPSTGYYSFSCTANFSNLTTPAGLTQVILAYTGSVQSLRLEQFGLVPATTGASLICTASWSMPMAANETVQMQPFADGAGNYIIAGAALSTGSFNTASTFSGFKVN